MKTGKLGLILLPIVLAGCTLNSQPAQTPETVTPTEVTTSTGTELTGTVSSGTTTAVAPRSYTLDEVALHTTKTDCWTAINGKVYDITSAFGKHKGGDDALMLLCGKDGTAPFEKQHGNNDKAKGWLLTLEIGRLK